MALDASVLRRLLLSLEREFEAMLFVHRLTDGSNAPNELALINQLRHVLAAEIAEADNLEAPPPKDPALQPVKQDSIGTTVVPA